MKKERIFWGIYLIMGAVFILAVKLGFMQGIGIWSLVFTLAFAAVLIKSLLKLNFFGIFLSLALLAIVYAEPLQIQAITPWPVLCAGLCLGIGFSLLFPKKYRKNGSRHTQIGGDRIINEPDGDVCSCSVNFGASIKYINSNAFEQAHLDNNFGSLKVYFDNAIMKGTAAQVCIDNNFGSIELYVPKTWSVNSQITNNLAGVDEKGHAQPDGVHVLYLYGENSFGGVTVIYI